MTFGIGAGTELDRDNRLTDNALVLSVRRQIVSLASLSPNMKRIFLLSRVFLRCLLLFPLLPGTALLSLSTAACIAMPLPQLSDETQPKPDSGEDAKDDEPGIKGLSEPDGKPPEVRDESDAIDPSNKDALAWYMSGQKALKRGALDEAVEAFQAAAAADPESAVPVRALAMVLFRMNKVEEGLSQAQKAMQIDPDDFETRLEMAVLYGTNGEFDDSIRLLDEALSSKRLKAQSFDFVHIHQVRGAVLLEMKNLSGAAESYEVILNALERPEDFNLSDREHKTLLKNRPTGYEVTGRILMQAGRLPRAILAFEALSRTEKDVPGEHNLLLARAYFQQDKLDLCEQNLNKYFESGQRSNESLLLLKDLFEATGRLDALTARIAELSADAADAGAVRMFLGQVLLDQGKTTEAADIYQSILDTTGEADAYLGLVRVEIANRNPAGLIATLNRAARSRITVVEMVPLVSSIILVDEFAKESIRTCQKMFADKPGDLHPAVPYFCSLVAEKMELGEEEAALLKATLELNPDQELSMQALDRYGMNQLKQREYAMAAKIFEQMLATPGLQPLARVNTLFRISGAYASIEDLDAARKALKEALRMVPNEPQLLGRLALVEAADGNLENAEKLLLKSIEGLQGNDELQTEARLRLAGIYAQLDQWANSVEQYLFVLDIESLDSDTSRVARMGLSNAYVQSGDMEKGEKVLEEVYEEDPTDKGVNNDLGYLYADQGKNLEKAETMIRIAVEAEPENPAYLDSLGWVLFKLGKNDEALDALKKANSDPEYQDATLLEHQGDVHQALQQTDEAKSAWKRAVEVEQKAKQPDQAVLKRLGEKLGETAKPNESPEPATPEKK